MNKDSRRDVKRPASAGDPSGPAGEAPGSAGWCPAPVMPDFAGVTQVALRPGRPTADYRVAMTMADGEARARLGDFMLLSWYDRDRDFESPQHASECHQDSAVPGYVDYGLNHGATLRVDVEDGRFVFFYMAVDL